MLCLKRSWKVVTLRVIAQGMRKLPFWRIHSEGAANSRYINLSSQRQPARPASIKKHARTADYIIILETITRLLNIVWLSTEQTDRRVSDRARAVMSIAKM